MDLTQAVAVVIAGIFAVPVTSRLVVMAPGRQASGEPNSSV